MLDNQSLIRSLKVVKPMFISTPSDQYLNHPVPLSTTRVTAKVLSIFVGGIFTNILF